MLRKTLLTFTLAIALFVPIAIELAHAAANDPITPPSVPFDLRVEANERPFLIGHAAGAQNYSCLPSATGFAWTLYGPQATLFDDTGEQIVTHFLSPNPDENGTPRPTWQHSRDTSAVWAVSVASSTDAAYVEPGAIPWLLLRIAGRQHGPAAGDKLMRTTAIHRVNTSGGAAPATGCSTAADLGRKALVPYTTDYIFYRN